MRVRTAGLVSALLVSFLIAGVILHGPPATAEQKHPDVVAVEVTPRGADRFDFDVTISSPYDTPQRYADGFRVVGPKGEVYGERKLLHDHASEQPFNRDLHGITIPGATKAVIVEARDQRYGYGGGNREVALPGR